MSSQVPRPRIVLSRVCGALGVALGATSTLAACGDSGEGDGKGAVAVFAVPAGRAFEGRLDVVLVSEPAGAIRYTLDGSAPTGPGALPYEGPITLREDALLSFVAQSPAGRWSSLETELYERTEAVRPYSPPTRGLEVSDDSLFFAAEAQDVVMRKVVRLLSVGRQPVRLEAIYIAPDGAFYEPGVFEVEGPDEPLLWPGQAMDLQVVYRVTPTLRTAQLVIESNDLNAPGGVWEVVLGGRLVTW